MVFYSYKIGRKALYLRKLKLCEGYLIFGFPFPVVNSKRATVRWGKRRGVGKLPSFTPWILYRFRSTLYSLKQSSRGLFPGFMRITCCKDLKLCGRTPHLLIYFSRCVFQLPKGLLSSFLPHHPLSCSPKNIIIITLFHQINQTLIFSGIVCIVL